MRLDMKMIHVPERPVDPKVTGARNLFQPGKPDELDAGTFSKTAFPDAERIPLQWEDPLRTGHRAYVTKTHFRVQGKAGFYAPSFWLTPSKPNEDIEGVCVGFGLPDDAVPRHYFEYLGTKDGARIFYDRPKGKYNDDGTEFDYNRGATSGTLGVVQAGSTDIFLVDSEGCVLETPRRLIVLPSSLTLSELGSMVQEIISVRRTLVQLDPEHQRIAKSELLGRDHALADGTDFQQMLGIVAQCLTDIEPYIEGMNDRPRSHLRASRQEVSARALNHMDARILRQYIENPARSKYTVAGGESTQDIYENRLIRNKLEKLRRYLVERHAQCLVDATTEKDNLLYFMQCESGGAAGNENDVYRTWAEQRHTADGQSLNAWKEKYRDEFDRILGRPPGWSWPEPKGTFSSDVDFHLNATDAFLNYRLAPGRISLQFRHTDVRDKETNTMKECPLLPYFKKAFHKAASCEIRTDSYREMLAFLLAFEALQGSGRTLPVCFAIHGNVECRPRRKNSLGDCNIIVYSIRSLRVAGVPQKLPNMNESEALKKIREHYALQRILKNQNAELALIAASNDDQLEERWKASKRVRDGLDKELYQQTLNTIDGFLTLPVLAKASMQNEEWRMTQIFTNDPNYHAVYEGLHRLDELYDFTFEVGTHNLIHEKIDVLYEYWILCRILKKLIIDQHWQPKDHATLLRVFNDFFDARTRYDAIVPDARPKGRAPHIDLTHKLRGGGTVRMSIWYNASLKEALPETPKDPHYSGHYHVERLRPDYLFRLHLAGQDDQVFFLDAKYRRYGNMGNTWLEDDLKEVCAYKYIDLPIRDAGLLFIRAAFIVHSDAMPGETNPNAYLGQYVTYDAALDERCMPINKAHEDQLVGSFYLVPQTATRTFNASELNLELFFRLIMEYAMECWSTCWHCGATDTIVRVLRTQGGYPKYHMICPHCHAFWVKNHCRDAGHTIVKHFINYFTEKDRATWFLGCPHCNANQPMREWK